MMFPPSGLPIDSITDLVCSEVGKTSSLIISAATGSGKSTILPLALHAAHPRKRIIMLEPRRIATRAIAARMAQLTNSPLGALVGFRTRFETLVSPQTAIEVVTEGILMRILQANPSLDGYDIVIFDEFHERTLQGDLALALTLESAALFRPDLTTLIMSATLDSDSISGFFAGAAKIFSSPGTLHDVAIHYRPPALPYNHPQAEHSFLRHMADVTAQALAHDEGDVLVFLPGEAEIHRLAAILESSPACANCRIMELYGNLPPHKQDDVFRYPSDDAPRRIIIATSIAETSITIPRIRIVIDSGLVRKPFFSPATGLDKLRTVRISKASADQRKGRAGRTAPGVCYRVWSMQDQSGMEDYTDPEILHSDLSETALELAAWGVPRKDVLRLRWMTPPPEVNLSFACELLSDLGAISGDGLVTPYGAALHRMPVHPRIAHACMFAMTNFGSAESALSIAALSGEKDLLPAAATADLSLRLAALAHPAPSVSRDLLRRIQISRKQLDNALLRALPHIPSAPAPALSASPLPSAEAKSALILAAAFPDRIARRRARDSYDYVMANGCIAHLQHGDPLQLSEYLAIADLGGLAASPSIFSALPLDISILCQFLPALIRAEHILSWDPDSRMVRAADITRIGSLVLSRKHAAVAPSDDPSRILIGVIRKYGLSLLPMSRRTLALLDRLRFLARCGYTQFSPFAAATLLDNLESWLAPSLLGMSKLEHLAKLSFFNIIGAMLSAQDKSILQKEAPEFFFAPSGSKLPIDYSGSGQPLVHVKLQELFGLARAPRLAGGRSALAFDLLSPAMRTVQITADIDAFWDGSYALVRKDMKSRYPKHNWPENPRLEPPSRSSVKRR